MNTHKEPLSECCSAKPCGELAYDNSGRCGDCKEGCMFVAECETSCGINADPADGFGRCTCGNEKLEPTPPSQIEEVLDWHNKSVVEALVESTVHGKDPNIVVTEDLINKHRNKAREDILVMLIDEAKWALNNLELIKGQSFNDGLVYKNQLDRVRTLQNDLEAINKLTKE